MRRWLLGPPGWGMPVCEIDLRVGGNRYERVDIGRGKTMSMGGVFTEVVKPELIGSKEKFDDDRMMGETVNTQVFTQKGGKTHMTLRSSTPSKEAREGARLERRGRRLPGGFHHYRSISFDRKRI